MYLVSSRTLSDQSGFSRPLDACYETCTIEVFHPIQRIKWLAQLHERKGSISVNNNLSVYECYNSLSSSLRILSRTSRRRFPSRSRCELVTALAPPLKVAGTAGGISNHSCRWILLNNRKFGQRLVNSVNESLASAVKELHKRRSMTGVSISYQHW
jgi:hypothetical protein